jgi:hypothetical protein
MDADGRGFSRCETPRKTRVANVPEIGEVGAR